jgi:excisionase family DNA binding protein
MAIRPAVPVGPSPATPSITPRLLSVPLAAVYLSATNFFVEELCRSGEIPYLQNGKGRVIDIRDLDKWIDKQKKQTGMMKAPKFAVESAA